jgi:hypothetical protein
VRVLRNRARGTAHWLGLRLAGRPPNTTALGARVTLERAGRPALLRQVQTDGSYLSAGDPRVLFGLGASGAAGRIVVEWPDGRRESWSDLAADRYHTLTAGEGGPL